MSTNHHHHPEEERSSISRAHFGIVLLGLCLLGMGIGILSVHMQSGEASADEPSPTTTTFTEPTTTTTSEVTTTTTTPKQRPTARRTEVGTPRSIVRARPTTTTSTTQQRRTPLEIAQSEVGKVRPEYFSADGWCYRLVNWAAEQAGIPGWQSESSESALYVDAVADGRFTQNLSVGDMVFIEEPFLHGQRLASHGGPPRIVRDFTRPRCVRSLDRSDTTLDCRSADSTALSASLIKVCKRSSSTGVWWTRRSALHSASMTTRYSATPSMRALSQRVSIS